MSSKGCYTPIKPDILTGLMPKILIKNIVSKTIKDINKQINNGYKLILLIDSDMLIDDFTWNPFELEYHWVVLEKPISFPDKKTTKKDMVHFEVYSWQSKNYLKSAITYHHFYENYYGYIKLK